MPEYFLKINYSIAFQSDKSLEELVELEQAELFKLAFNAPSGDFWGNGIQVWERVFKDGNEYSKNPPENGRYGGID